MMAIGIFVAAAAVAPAQQAPHADMTITVRMQGNAPMTVGLAQLGRLPAKSVRGGVHGGPERSYDGALLADILALAGAPLGDKLHGKALELYLVVEAADGYRAVYALPELDPAFNDRPITLACRCDGAPLDAKSGPFQIVAPGEKKGARWVRGVTSLTVMRADAGKRE
jgi:hypothetical protein